MAAESAQFNGANLVYILPKPTPDFCTTKMPQSKNKPLAKIAPLSAPAKGYGTPPLKPPKREREEDNEIVRCKRRLDFARLGLPMHRQSPAVAAKRNERERKRVKYINETFDVLKNHLPAEFQTPKAKTKELSKVEILRGAIDYIMTLEDMLKSTNINFESQFSALIQASDDIGELDSLSYPDTPSSSTSISQSSKAVKDLLSSIVAASASPALSTVSTPSQRVPELQMVDSPASSIDSQTQSQLVPDVQQIVASPVPSLLHSHNRQCSTPQTNHHSTPNTTSQTTSNYVTVTQPTLINSTEPQQNYNTLVPNISQQQGFTGDLFSTDFSNLQCASNNNNNNLVFNSDLNANKLHDKNVLNNNNIKCDQYAYTLNLDCSYVPNIDMSSALSTSSSAGYGNPATPNLSSPAPSLISNVSAGFQMEKGFGEDNNDFMDFASLLMGCDMK